MRPVVGGEHARMRVLSEPAGSAYVGQPLVVFRLGEPEEPIGLQDLPEAGTKDPDSPPVVIRDPVLDREPRPVARASLRLRYAIAGIGKILHQRRQNHAANG